MIDGRSTSSWHGINLIIKHSLHIQFTIEQDFIYYTKQYKLRPFSLRNELTLDYILLTHNFLTKTDIFFTLLSHYIYIKSLR